MLAQIVTTVLGFFLLVAVLRKFFWRAVLQSLDARRQHIEQSLADVERAKLEIERMKDEYGQRLHRIEDEARGKLREATLEGQRIATDIQEQARLEARTIVEDMKAKLHLDIAQAKVELRDQIVALTIDATERLLRERLDANKDRALVTRFLEELEAAR